MRDLSKCNEFKLFNCKWFTSGANEPKNIGSIFSLTPRPYQPAYNKYFRASEQSLLSLDDFLFIISDRYLYLYDVDLSARFFISFRASKHVENIKLLKQSYFSFSLALPRLCCLLINSGCLKAVWNVPRQCRELEQLFIFCSVSRWQTWTASCDEKYLDWVWLHLISCHRSHRQMCLECFNELVTSSCLATVLTGWELGFIRFLKPHVFLVVWRSLRELTRKGTHSDLWHFWK